ncbi:MAG: hypothetical protein JRM79_02075 [Nitrososphaerota archaeon]|jgi:hypothetical protein|nr:hypothetical protein [Nitrososphaerota archaeon]MDG6969621.1 hypothetical protein [Nitrososphaerota archaeon]MDG6972533.1 hypothetical protein [Nitrososphaerota archaeon]MDG6987170.1 hypothetical protein [Nitrososphaerota archaeon]MDG6993429.1 hypothetical protein [Nitrososphaerota archaeon]
MVDVLTVVVAGVVGLGLGGLASYVVFYTRPKQTRVAVKRADAQGRTVESTVTTADLERSRRDMRTIMVERDLLSSAMMKLYEAESEGRITREEREMISKRYSDQIKELQAKLKDVELVVEVGELEGLRGELVTLFESKIRNIESRLDVAKQRLGPAAPQPARKEVTPKVEKATDLERAVERRAKPEMSESEKRVKVIRDEVMDALTKLEQIDIEKKQQEG